MEVVVAIKRLKRIKANYPSHNILNEYFIETSYVLLGHVTNLFNKVFSGGLDTGTHCANA